MHGAPGTDFRNPFVSYDLKLHHGLMGGSMQFRRFEQPHIIGMPFVFHEVIDVPCRRRRAPGEILSRDDDIESVARVDQGMADLLPHGGFDEGVGGDAQRAERFLLGKGDPAGGLKAGHVSQKGGILV